MANSGCCAIVICRPSTRSPWCWQKILNRKGRKTSDRVLVYVKRPDGEFLLIFVLDEPGAHQVAKMESLADRQLMHALSAVAEQFFAGDL